MHDVYNVYAHRRLDTNEIFCVGHGHHARPWATKRGRSKDWIQVYNQAGRRVEIFARYKEKDLAAAHEVLLIAACRELGIPLVNKRHGGYDRNDSIPHTAEARAKMSAMAKLRPPMSAETRAKISQTLRNKKRT
jgi:hypothetical protein